MSGTGPSKHLRFMERRVKWLKERVAKSTTEFSFDKSEIAALEWAITNLQHTRVIAHRVKQDEELMYDHRYEVNN